MQPSKEVKRAIKLLVNLTALLCTVILLVLVAATQTNDLPLAVLTLHSHDPTTAAALTDPCSLNVGTEGVCACALHTHVYSLLSFVHAWWYQCRPSSKK